MTLRSRIGSIMGVIRLEQLELFALELENFFRIVLNPEHNFVMSSLIDLKRGIVFVAIIQSAV